MFEFDLKTEFLNAFNSLVKSRRLDGIGAAELISLVTKDGRLRNSFSSMNVEQVRELMLSLTVDCVQLDSPKTLELLVPNINLLDLGATPDFIDKLKQEISIQVFDELGKENERLKLFVSDNDVIKQKIALGLVQADNQTIDHALKRIVENDSLLPLKSEVLKYPRLSTFFVEKVKDLYRKSPKKVMPIIMQLGDDFTFFVRQEKFKSFMRDELLRDLKHECIPEFNEKFQLYAFLVSDDELTQFICDSAEIAFKNFNQSYIGMQPKLTLARIYGFTITNEHIRKPVNYLELRELTEAYNISCSKHADYLRGLISTDEFAKSSSVTLYNKLDGMQVSNISIWLRVFATIVTASDNYSDDIINRTPSFNEVQKKYDELYQEIGIEDDKPVLSFYVVNHHEISKAKHTINDIALAMEIPSSIESIDEKFIASISTLVQFIYHEKDFEIHSCNSKDKNEYASLIDFLVDYDNDNYSLYEFRRFLINVANLFIFPSEGSLSLIPEKESRKIASNLLGLADEISLYDCYAARRVEVLLEGMFLEVEQLRGILSESDLTLLFRDIIEIIDFQENHLNNKYILMAYDLILSSIEQGHMFTELYELVIDRLTERYSEEQLTRKPISIQEASLLKKAFDILETREVEPNLLAKLKNLYALVDKRSNFQVDFNMRDNLHISENFLFNVALFKFSFTTFEGDEFKNAINKFKKYFQSLNNEILYDVHQSNFVSIVINAFHSFIGFGNEEINEFLNNEMERIHKILEENKGKGNASADYLLKELRRSLNG